MDNKLNYASSSDFISYGSRSSQEVPRALVT